MSNRDMPEYLRTYYAELDRQIANKQRDKEELAMRADPNERRWQHGPVIEERRSGKDRREANR